VALLELRNVSKIYHTGGEEIRALDDVSLDLQNGEFISIIGPSGSGKSTLMHILGCLDSPSRGEVRLDGVDISRASAGQLAKVRNRTIGFVFQSFNLLPKLNVLQNVELPMVYAGMGGRERRERAMESLRQVDLAHRVKNRPNQLSGGQQQRVAIARALVNDPKIILADEPTGNLDPATGEGIMALLDEINRTGTTVVMATHDHRVVNAMRKRVIQLDRGVIVRDQERGVYE